MILTVVLDQEQAPLHQNIRTCRDVEAVRVTYVDDTLAINGCAVLNEVQEVELLENAPFHLTKMTQQLSLCNILQPHTHTHTHSELRKEAAEIFKYQSFSYQQETALGRRLPEKKARTLEEGWTIRAWGERFPEKLVWRVPRSSPTISHAHAFRLHIFNHDCYTFGTNQTNPIGIPYRGGEPWDFFSKSSHQWQQASQLDRVASCTVHVRFMQAYFARAGCPQQEERRHIKKQDHGSKIDLTRSGATM